HLKLDKDAGKNLKKPQTTTTVHVLHIHIFIYICNVCFASGFKRGADPGMPEPTIWRYGLYLSWLLIYGTSCTF
uniref:Uncharacterized protein n=1 Tax=Buteo japonicus TaxID=224669 RepID=A0A8C0HIW1_9AVES